MPLKKQLRILQASGQFRFAWQLSHPYHPERRQRSIRERPWSRRWWVVGSRNSGAKAEGDSFGSVEFWFLWLYSVDFKAQRPKVCYQNVRNPQKTRIVKPNQTEPSKQTSKNLFQILYTSSALLGTLTNVIQAISIATFEAVSKTIFDIVRYKGTFAESHSSRAQTKAGDKVRYTERA